ncbi:MAG: PAS-domain containing protein [Alphaproteobacteria bacterium]|nr:PAS-domain containing protein [Alphaproteobacteria bacterium]
MDRNQNDIENRKRTVPANQDESATNPPADAQPAWTQTRFNEVLEALDEALVLWDSDLQFVMSNRRLDEMFNTQDLSPQPGDHIGDVMQRQMKRGSLSLPDGISPDQMVGQWIAAITNYEKDIEVTTKDGRILSASSHKTSLNGYLVTIRDITAQRHTYEDKLAAISDAVQALDDVITLYDSDLRFVFSNQKRDSMFYEGQNHQEVGKSLYDVALEMVTSGMLVLPEGQTADQWVTRAIEIAKTYEKNYPMKTGDGRQILASSHKSGLDGYLLTFRDVTNERRAEEDRLAAVNDAIQALDEGLVLYDSEMNFVIGNRKLHDIFYSDDVAPPQVGENVVDTMKRLIDSEFYVIPEGLSKTAFLDQMTNTIKSYRKNAVLTSQAGRVLNTSVHKTALGGYLVSFSDITEQRRIERELERQREIAHQNEKLSALGELLAGVAHELNNPLSIVVGYAQMVQGRIDDPVINRRVERIAEAAERSAKIVRAFLAMARQRPARMENCRLNDVIEDALSVAGSGVRSSGARIELELDASLPLVMADADQMAQVFINLIVNAEHVLTDLGERGKLIVRTFYDDRTGDVIAEVHDNGPGIEPDIQSRIFEPFFTTKDVGSGTGVGLAYSHRIVDNHGGRLTLRSNARSGTSFFVRLSAVGGPALETNPPLRKLANGRTHRILVVDDEEHVADLIRELLECMGHQVTTAKCGRDGLRCIEEAEFDVILSDFKMPDLDGEGFHAALKKTRPDLAARLGIITGDSMGQKVLAFLRSGACPHIEKPIDVAELSALIEQLASNGGDPRP